MSGVSRFKLNIKKQSNNEWGVPPLLNIQFKCATAYLILVWHCQSLRKSDGCWLLPFCLISGRATKKNSPDLLTNYTSLCFIKYNDRSIYTKTSLQTLESHLCSDLYYIERSI